jgi:hypothetical protein
MVTKRLSLALAGLFAFQFLHGLAPPPDDAPDEGGFTGLVGGVFFLLATMLAWYWVRRSDERGPRLALALGIAIPVGFLLYHGAWFTSPVTNPYWGDGEASGWQWASLVPVMVLGLLTAKLAAEHQEYRASVA